MVKLVKNKSSKIILALFIFLILALGVFCVLLFYNSSYNAAETKVSAALVNKIREAQAKGSTIDINKEELNEIMGMYSKTKSSGNITVKGVQGDILDNNIKFYVPVNYKGFNILITSQGTLSYDNNKIQYKPSYFKAGKITMPQNLVLSKLKSHLKKGMSIENGAITIDKSMLAIGIKDLKVKDNKISLTIEKLNMSLEEKLKAISQGMKNSTSTNTNSAGGSKTSGNNSTEASKGNSSESGKASSNSKDTSERDAALDRISGGLSAASGSVSTGNEKAIISEMISAVNSMKGNPNASPSVGSVSSAYKNLSPQEKAELQAAISSNINGADINLVTGMLKK